MADVQLLHTRSKDQANDEAFVAPLKSATGVWFGGGDQTKIAEAYLGTAVERELLGLAEPRRSHRRHAAPARPSSRKTMIAGGQIEPKMGTGFDFLPGAIIDQHFKARNRQNRLRKALIDHPGLVGLGVDEGTALVVRGRRLQVFGKGTVSVFLAPSASRPAREFELAPRESHDLTMLRRAAIDRSLAEFPGRDLPPPKLAGGSLVIVGGGGLPKEVTAKFIELAGGPDALIVVLPTADERTQSTQAIQGTGSEGASWNGPGPRTSRCSASGPGRKSSRPSLPKCSAEAKGVWFGGGRQWRFVDCYAGTKAEQLFHERAGPRRRHRRL